MEICVITRPRVDQRCPGKQHRGLAGTRKWLVSPLAASLRIFIGISSLLSLLNPIEKRNMNTG